MTKIETAVRNSSNSRKAQAKRKLEGELEYTFSNGAKSAATNVKLFGSKLSRAEKEVDKVYVGIHLALGKQPLTVDTKGELKKVASLFDLARNKALYTSNDTENPGFGYLQLVEVWANSQKGFQWKTQTLDDEGKAVTESNQADADIIKRVLLDGLGKAKGSVNYDIAQKIRGAFSSFANKRFNKFCRSAMTALFNEGITIADDLMQLVDDPTKTGNKREPKTFDERINGNGNWQVGSDGWHQAMKASGDVKKAEANKNILESLIGKIGNAFSSDSIKAEYGVDFQKEVTMHLRQFQVGFEATLKKYKSSEPASK